MPRVDWRTALRALVGFLAALAVWIALSPLYNRMLASAAEWTLRLFEKPQVTRLNPLPDGNYVSLDRTDFDPRSKHPAVPVNDLTFNFLLLTALFSLEKRPFRDRNIGGFALASLILILTHVLALVSEVMSVYALQLGAWSRANYGDFARNFWGVMKHAYRVVGMYAIAFGLWWLCRPAVSEETKEAKPARRRKR